MKCVSSELLRACFVPVGPGLFGRMCGWGWECSVVLLGCLMSLYKAPLVCGSDDKYWVPAYFLVSWSLLQTCSFVTSPPYPSLSLFSLPLSFSLPAHPSLLSPNPHSSALYSTCNVHIFPAMYIHFYLLMLTLFFLYFNNYSTYSFHILFSFGANNVFLVLICVPILYWSSDLLFLRSHIGGCWAK